jgi:hypothetical protein
MSWFDVLKVLGPMVLTLFPKVAPIAPILVHAIGEAEAFKDSGDQKKQHVLQLVADGVAVTNSVSQRIVLDPVQTGQTASVAIDAVVAVVNTIHAAQAQEPPAV